MTDVKININLALEKEKVICLTLLEWLSTHSAWCEGRVLHFLVSLQNLFWSVSREHLTRLPNLNHFTLTVGYCFKFTMRLKCRCAQSRVHNLFMFHHQFVMENDTCYSMHAQEITHIYAGCTFYSAIFCTVTYAVLSVCVCVCVCVCVFVSQILHGHFWSRKMMIYPMYSAAMRCKSPCVSCMQWPPFNDYYPMCIIWIKSVYHSADLACGFVSGETMLMLWRHMHLNTNPCLTTNKL